LVTRREALVVSVVAAAHLVAVAAVVNFKY